nr:MAG TPA: hypothetical protein [Bacteriophage sp.]
MISIVSNSSSSTSIFVSRTWMPRDLEDLLGRLVKAS